MKVVCDSCRTQYLVPDEKIGSRGIKIRCKKCGHIVVWRPEDPAQQRLAAEEAGASLSSAADPFADRSGEGDELGQAFDRLLKGEPAPASRSEEKEEEEDEEDGGETQLFSLEDLQRLKKGNLAPDDQQKIDAVFSEASSTSVAAGRAEASEEWYLAVRDEQVGPVRREELEGYWNRGEINAKTLAWCQGMSDWVPIESIALLKYLVAAKPAATPAGSQPQKQWVETASSSLTSLVEEELQAVASKPPPAEKEPAKAKEMDGGEEEEVPPWEKEEVVSGEVARPSGGYFDPSLSLTTTDTGSPLPRKTGLEKPAYLAKESRLGGWKLIFAGGAGALVGAVIILFVVLGGNKNPPAANDNAAASSARAEPAASKEEPAKNAPPEQKKEPSSTEEAALAEAKPEQKAAAQEDVIVAQKPKKEISPPNEEKDKTKLATRPDKTARPKPVAAKTEKQPATAQEKPAQAAPPQEAQAGQISKEQVAATMKKYVAVMKNCVAMQKERDPSVTGTMIVSFVILPSGKTSEVKVQTSEHQGTFVASCILRVISEITFPAFSGPPYPIPRLPLKLGD